MKKKTEKTNESRRDVFERVTERLIEAMEEAQGNWTKPWIGGGFGMASNAKTKQCYKGGNALLLGFMGGGEWATFKQWQELGAKVKKGEKGIGCIKWVNFSQEVPSIKLDGENAIYSGMFPNCFTVFSANQVEGYEPESIEERTDVEKFAAAETIIEQTKAHIEWEAQDKAFYSPSRDKIGMPLLKQFETTEGYYSVLLHELTHWSGHSSRMDRFPSVGISTTEEYAFEELVAEIGAAFLLAQCGLCVEPRKDHAEYLSSWIKRCKKEPRAMFNAASKAQAAVDFILTGERKTKQEKAA